MLPLSLHETQEVTVGCSGGDSVVRQFVVGTGGQSLYEPQVGDAAWRETFDPIPSDAFDAAHHGFLDLTLTDGAYNWSFITDTGAVTDTGSAPCSR